MPLFESRVCRTVCTDADYFGQAKSIFLKRLGQGRSFTVCVSVVVMKELRLREALIKGSHFGEAGFTVLLPV
jgi:predicted nucleic acid-binding protein